MKRSNVFLGCALVGLFSTACSSGINADAANGGTSVEVTQQSVTVSGRAELFPEAASLFQAQGQLAPALDGLQITLEEPLAQGVNDANAVLGQGPVGADQTFSVSGVRVDGIHLSLAARLEHPGLVPSATIVFDTALTRTRPSLDLNNTRVWALPESFHTALTNSIGETAIRGQSGGQKATLRDAGFVLGRVVDASGAPLAGAQVVPEYEELGARVYYPSPDFQSASQSGTSATGLFVYVHSGDAPQSFQLAVKAPGNSGNSGSYTPRNVTAAAGSALILTLSPGGGLP